MHFHFSICVNERKFDRNKCIYCIHILEKFVRLSHYWCLQYFVCQFSLFKKIKIFKSIESVFYIKYSWISRGIFFDPNFLIYFRIISKSYSEIQLSFEAFFISGYASNFHVEDKLINNYSIRNNCVMYQY